MESSPLIFKDSRLRVKDFVFIFDPVASFAISRLRFSIEKPFLDPRPRATKFCPSIELKKTVSPADALKFFASVSPLKNSFSDLSQALVNLSSLSSPNTGRTRRSLEVTSFVEFKLYFIGAPLM